MTMPNQSPKQSAEEPKLTATAVVGRILNYIDRAGHFEGRGKQHKLLIQGTLNINNKPVKIKDATIWFEEWIEQFATQERAEQKKKDAEIARAFDDIDKFEKLCPDLFSRYMKNENERGGETIATAIERGDG